ncbi:RHTO0S01e17656g1_1 [Rhodotorula toruloides]|uniref:RHTO0S01e17656g1_1 n=1 Tax=Rhodotorula toruloides TaxID=5286 RepID=A0A061AF93_RHOTO|nr:RHTO0S01e17656g1_1 [Rhodotorula toruloides]
MKYTFTGTLRRDFRQRKFGRLTLAHTQVTASRSTALQVFKRASSAARSALRSGMQQAGGTHTAQATTSSPTQGRAKCRDLDTTLTRSSLSIRRTNRKSCTSLASASRQTRLKPSGRPTHGQPAAQGTPSRKASQRSSRSLRLRPGLLARALAD